MGFWESLGGVELFFLSCATVGGTAFLIQIVLMLVGVADGADGDVGHDADGDVGHDADVGGAHQSTDFSFKLLSLQGITGFLLMFGLIGLAMLRQFHPAVPIATLAGIAAGLLLVYVMSWIFTGFRRLQHSGTMNLGNAVGQEGRVYLGIPAGGEPGKVEVAIQNRLCVLDAVSEDSTALPTDTRVRVVRLSRGNLLVVQKL